jgi:hypothetical protein
LDKDLPRRSSFENQDILWFKGKATSLLMILKTLSLFVLRYWYVLWYNVLPIVPRSSEILAETFLKSTTQALRLYKTAFLGVVLRVFYLRKPLRTDCVHQCAKAQFL